METAIGQQAPQVVELSEENKEKVCLITDINKVYKLLKGVDISPTYFDLLYSASIHIFETTLEVYQYQQECVMACGR